MSEWIAKYDNEVLELSNIFEEGGALIRVYKSGVVRLYEIPQYGGEERGGDTYLTVCHAIEKAESWT